MGYSRPLWKMRAWSHDMAARYQEPEACDAGQLTAMRDAAAVLLEHERHVSPDVITVLCQIREETAAELKARQEASADQPTPSPAHHPAPWAAGQLDAVP
jgi:hypothetical protein